MLNICLVAHFAYDAIKGGNTGFIGGVERQTTLMAKWLAEKGHKVSLLTWADGNSEDEVIDGINVIKICRKDAGIPGVRFFYPRWSGLISAMKRANADVYYQNCGEYITGQIAMWCKLNNKQFLYSLASDADADPALPVMTKLRERVLYRYGLRHADHILSQTEKQVNLLASGFQLASTVMPMPCPGPTENQYQPLKYKKDKPTILWAARIHPCKRLELLLEVAESLPEFQFVVGGSPLEEDDYSDALFNTMKRLDNVSYLGMVGRDDMPALYRSSTLFCCTSEYEGFPNTFLESWSNGLPIVSTFDPDDLIQKKQLGLPATSKDELIAGIRSLCKNEQQWSECSHNARSYYQNNHSVDEVMTRFEKVFKELSN
ncbi:glycosyltransferase family 4 protein [Psychromonas hadalis]|uniref:glycosyltransferase family 4 protein n=1 Tax=Psychromonas hadalis TaxID=211669 RepID=UPI0003B6662E|nr:glycosyltransferase family 4 protein [Psychromonas hadalis]